MPVGWKDGDTDGSNDGVTLGLLDGNRLGTVDRGLEGYELGLAVGVLGADKDGIGVDG